MKTTIYLLSFVITCTFLGCTTNFWQDAASRNHNNVYDAMFADSVRDAINAELKLQNPPWGIPAWGTTWREFWIERCEQVYHSPGMGDAYVQYIVDQRHTAGLPDIPEIDKRQFRSEWQIFKDHVDKQLDQELQSSSPPAITDGKIRVKTWPDYWKVVEENALRNSAVSTNGVEYINDHRKQVGLPPLN